MDEVELFRELMDSGHKFVWYTDALERNYQTRFFKHFTYGCVRVRFPLLNATAS